MAATTTSGRSWWDGMACIGDDDVQDVGRLVREPCLQRRPVGAHSSGSPRDALSTTTGTSGRVVTSLGTGRAWASTCGCRGVRPGGVTQWHRPRPSGAEVPDRHRTGHLPVTPGGVPAAPAPRGQRGPEVPARPR